MGKKIFGETQFGKRKAIWETLSGVQAALDLSDAKLASLLKVDEEEFCQMRENSLEPSVYSGMNLCEQLEVGFDLFVKGEIDFDVLALQHGIDPRALPERYTVGATSKRGSIKNLLDYIQHRFGGGYRNYLLRQFQVREAALKDSLAPINVRLGADIVSFLLRRYDDPGMILEMGRHSAEFNRHTAMGRELEQARNLRELFLMMVESVAPKYVTQNFTWKVRFQSPFHGIMEGLPDLSLLPLVGAEYLMGREACLIRTGFISSIPCYLGYPAIDLKKVSCVVQGDRSCKYELDLQPLLKSHKHGNLREVKAEHRLLA